MLIMLGGQLQVSSPRGYPPYASDMTQTCVGLHSKCCSKRMCADI